MEIKEYVDDWALKFIKNKDIIFRKIVSIESSSNEFYDAKVIYKDKIQYLVSRAKLEEIINLFPKISNDFYLWITVVNSKENFNFLIKNWDRFMEYKNISICFINPFSSTDVKWIVNPYTHNIISEKSSLNAGLKAMYETVEPISEEEFSLKIKSISQLF